MAKKKSARTAKEAPNKNPTAEQSIIQLPNAAMSQYLSHDNILSKPDCELWPQFINAIRKHPTVWFAQYIALAPLLESGWSVQADSTDEDVAKIAAIVKKVILPWSWHIIERSLFGQHEFGWQAFELVWDVEDIDDQPHIVPRKIKELVQDFPTDILSNNKGDLLGFKQDEVTIPANKCLYIAQRVRGSNYYGESSYKAVWPLVQSDMTVSEHADRHDRWSSGSKIIVRYPVGTSLVSTSAGTLAQVEDNKKIADRVLNAMKQGEGAAMPAGRTEGSNSWDLTHVSDPVSHETRFTNRQRFLDTRILHIFLVPERSATEGQFGTKAEAGTHGDLGLQLQFIQHAKITEAVSDQIVDRMIEYNWGRKYVGRVKVTPTPLDDKRIKFYQELYMKLLDSDEISFVERLLVDMNALRTSLSVPLRAGVNEKDMLQQLQDDRQTMNQPVNNPAPSDDGTKTEDDQQSET